MPRGLALLIARLASNSNKDLFTVRLGVTLLLGKYGLVGPWFNLLNFFLRSVVGLMIEDGTFVIDVGLDAYREGAKLKEFEKMALEAYRKATFRLYDEDEKNAIRKQYMEIIARIGVVGNPK